MKKEKPNWTSAAETEGAQEGPTALVRLLSDHPSGLMGDWSDKLITSGTNLLVSGLFDLDGLVYHLLKKRRTWPSIWSKTASFGSS